MKIYLKKMNYFLAMILVKLYLIAIPRTLDPIRAKAHPG